MGSISSANKGELRIRAFDTVQVDLDMFDHALQSIGIDYNKPYGFPCPCFYLEYISCQLLRMSSNNFRRLSSPIAGGLQST
jgi:hypothetical protein